MSVFKTVDSKSLLVPGRIDLVAKYVYVEDYINKYNTAWARDLYRAHIEAFSGGNYTEPTNLDKNSIEKYEDYFKRLIESVKKDGLNSDVSTVPVSLDGQITDGAHRTSIALFYGIKVPVEQKDESTELIYDYTFFREQLIEEKYLQYMAYRYIILKPD